jgi:hypothetical protein
MCKITKIQSKTSCLHEFRVRNLDAEVPNFSAEEKEGGASQVMWIEMKSVVNSIRRPLAVKDVYYQIRVPFKIKPGVSAS